MYFAGGGTGDPYGTGWQSVSKAVRKLDTIDMDEEIKSDLVRDAEYYYSDQSYVHNQLSSEILRSLFSSIETVLIYFQTAVLCRL